MKYLLQAIDARRECVRLSDHELRDLLIEVRNGKDDRIEFTESMVRLLEELKSSEHAVAFLTKVAKRDAPDYYDVIKNPMDLGTMLRNVRSARYKSKAQFMRDLDLIWDNCLTYNSEPTHPLRRSVQVLRSKANHLLTYVNDTNDVKEALSQWQASLGLRSRPANAISNDDMQSLADVSTTSAKERVGSIAVPRMSVAILNEMPFEQRPALLRKSEGMETFNRLDQWQESIDRSFGDRYLFGKRDHTIDQFGFGAGPSTSPALDTAACEDMLRTLEGSEGGVLRQAMTKGAKSQSTSSNNGNAFAPEESTRASNGLTIEEDIPYPFEAFSNNATTSESSLHSAGSWWDCMSHPSMLPSGHGHLPKAQQLPVKRVKYARDASKARRPAHVAIEPQADGERHGKAKKRLAGGAESMSQNIRTISHLRRIHNKFGRLQHHIESGEPMPAELAVISSDEEDVDEEETDPANLRERSSRPGRRRKAPDTLIVPLHEMLGNPYASLGGERALTVLQEKTEMLLAHAGFDGAQRGAADIIADIAGEYLMNVGRSLRSYSDRFSAEMSAEELILHSLHENGGIDVRGLETYVADDVVRYGHKMSELLRKLRASYKDTLATSDLTMADEAAYFGQNGVASTDPAMQSTTGAAMVGEEEEHILPGGFAAGLADEDFFGFKDLGLDDELGMDVGRQLASMPSRVFSRREQGGVGIEAKNRLGPGSGQSNSTVVLDFEPPPPHVEINESAIAAQIGLMRPFLRELIRTRGQWHATGSNEISSDASYRQEGAVQGQDQDAEALNDDQRPGHLILHDEEQERQRYKVPPTGKLPRRSMKDRSSTVKSFTATNVRTQTSGPLTVNGTASRVGDGASPATALGSRNGAMAKGKGKKKQSEKAGRSAQSVAVS